MGFPSRISRAAFGPMTLRNRYKVSNNSEEAGAELFALMWWQLAGAGLVCPLAVAVVRWDGALMQKDLTAEAWDPNSAFVPLVTRSSTGVYVIEYAATYPDDVGTDITTAFKWALVVPQDNAGVPMGGVISGGRIITTGCRQLVGDALYDPPSVLIVTG